MVRLLAFVLALLLPFQLAWGMAATYCQHETATQAATAQATSQAAWHFGHHEHAHEEGGGQAGGKLLVDTDCGFCHSPAPHASPLLANGLQPPLASARRAVSPAPDIRSAPARAPDRPQWARLV